MQNQEKELFIGIDLGGKEKKTTGICVLEKTGDSVFPLRSCCGGCRDILGKEVLKEIKPYLKDTKAIAIDGPLTKGRGKGKMRLYEKFLSMEIFRKEKVNPLPPALMSKFCEAALELRKKLEKEGFVLDLNLIEVFPTLIRKVYNPDLFFSVLKKENFPCVYGEKSCVGQPATEHQKSALICAVLAYFHFSFKTRYLGYRDGFLFLPEMSFWKEEWREKFYKAWRVKPYLHYRYLITNIFTR